MTSSVLGARLWNCVAFFLLYLVTVSVTVVVVVCAAATLPSLPFSCRVLMALEDANAHDDLRFGSLAKATIDEWTGRLVRLRHRENQMT